MQLFAIVKVSYIYLSILWGVASLFAARFVICRKSSFDFLSHNYKLKSLKHRNTDFEDFVSIFINGITGVKNLLQILDHLIHMSTFVQLFTVFGVFMIKIVGWKNVRNMSYRFSCSSISFNYLALKKTIHFKPIFSVSGFSSITASLKLLHPVLTEPNPKDTFEARKYCYLARPGPAGSGYPKISSNPFKCASQMLKKLNLKL